MVPRTADELFALPDRVREIVEQTTRIVSRMREEGVTLTAAARDAQVDPKAVVRLAGSALKKRKNGRYVAARRDRLLRVLVIPEANGMREVALRDSTQASIVSRYFTALRRYLHGGDAGELGAFRQTSITLADGSRVPLLTDRAAVDRLAGAGVLAFESIYARSA